MNNKHKVKIIAYLTASSMLLYGCKMSINNFLNKDKQEVPKKDFNTEQATEESEVKETELVFETTLATEIPETTKEVTVEIEETTLPTETETIITESTEEPETTIASTIETEEPTIETTEVTEETIQVSEETEVPEETYVLQAVKPLVYMFSQLQNECIRTSDIVNTSSELYRKALRYIYDNYMNSFTIEEMAKTLNYSESYLRHIFVKQSGKSIAKTVLAIRLSQASTLLVSTNLSVTTIALECGFCDGNYFSTVFKKKYGVSPMKYRQGNL